MPAPRCSAPLWWATPFSLGWASVMSAVTSLMGFAGGLTMSAIKRDRGVQGLRHAGGRATAACSTASTRICFAAPVFYHLTRFFFTDQSLAYNLMSRAGSGGP